MHSILIRKNIIASWLMLLGLTACGEEDSQTSGPIVATANPAAVFCHEQGGEYLLDGGRCRLPSTTVDAWAYFREYHNKQSEAGHPNPAAVFCNHHGTYDLETGDCQLDSGTKVNAWDFFSQQFPHERAIPLSDE